MSDARSLLRQQRAARRIQHPHVQYSAPGKLSCTICQEPIKSEALWDSHTRSAAHRQRLLASAKGPRASGDADSAATNGSSTGVHGEQKSKSSTDTLSDEALLAQIIGGTGLKRKHDEDEDVEMDDAAEEDDTAPTKRSKPDLGSPTANTSLSSPSTTAANGSTAKPDSQPDKDTERSKRTPTGATPPGLVRRISGTPSHGVELQIPSRPATPSASATSTPKATPMGRSPLIPQEGQTAGLPSTIKPPPKAAFASTTGKESTATTPVPAPGNEDDDWAAFESEVVHAASAPAKSTVTAAAGYSGDAVIAAAPMTTEQIAAKQEEEERERRRAQADVDLEDEKEEATRALETEFEEMEELEARVRKLKEKREAIRRGSVPTAAAGSLDDSNKTSLAAPPAAKQNVNGSAETEEEDEDDDDDEEDDDDWAGFRFRA
ncbi:hypothetical protein N0V93_002683 [Gnomoniopsis smithogilvyi]|uniref:Coiled-coil domain-containing protein 16 n=1 Tax=Gnomoniopsis smithogilvyi TaxID=1191159 RepID=A0A9W8YX17_9PEZI|nr:hypothetical protein N0V93_002683 [Gnomoniopsis smithogilvyi]